MATLLMILFPVVAFVSPKQVPVFLILVSVAVLVQSIRRRPWFSFTDAGTAIGAMGLFVAYFTLSGTWSDAPLNGVREGAKLVAFTGMVAILFTMPAANRDFVPKVVSNRGRIIAPLVYIAVLLCALIVGLINGDEPTLVDTALARFQVNRFNEFHAIIAVLFFPTLITIQTNRCRYTPLILVAVIVLVAADAVWVLALETVKLALVVSILTFFLVFAVPRIGRIAAVAIVCAISIMPFFLVHLPPSVFAELPHTLLHRIAIWDFTFPHIGDHLWVGIGLDGARSIPGGDAIIDGVSGIASTFPDAVREKLILSRAQYLPLHTHNTVVQILLEGGLLGLAFYVVFAAALIGTIFKYCTQRFELACAVSFMVLIVTINAASFGAWQSWWWGTLLLGVYSFRSARRIDPPRSAALD